MRKLFAFRKRLVNYLDLQVRQLLPRENVEDGNFEKHFDPEELELLVEVGVLHDQFTEITLQRYSSVISLHLNGSVKKGELVLICRRFEDLGVGHVDVLVRLILGALA